MRGHAWDERATDSRKKDVPLLTVLFFILWIVFNGRFTWELAAFGAVIAPALAWFTRKFMLDSGSSRARRAFFRQLPALARYLWLLIKEVALANRAVLHLILSDRRVVQPKLSEFHTNLKTRSAQIMLADCITLTPGTITVSLENDRYLVHCLDEEFEDGLQNSAFEQRLLQMEKRAEEIAAGGKKK